jgi:hypothetical protein
VTLMRIWEGKVCGERVYRIRPMSKVGGLLA